MPKLRRSNGGHFPAADIWGTQMSIEAIREALEACISHPDAVPGVWAIERDLPLSAFADEDFNFIAACSPAAIRALLQRMDEAEAEVQALRRGEFICGKCGLRKNSDAGHVPF